MRSLPEPVRAQGPVWWWRPVQAQAPWWQPVQAQARERALSQAAR